MKLNKTIEKKIKTKKGLTIVEVFISFSISIILLLSLLIVVYWGSNISTINQKFIDISNIINFISYELQNNTAKYFYINNLNNELTLRTDAINTLEQTIKSYNYKIGNSYDYHIESINYSKYSNSNTLYEVKVKISYIHKDTRRITEISTLISTTNLEIRGINNNFPPNDINPTDITRISPTSAFTTSSTSASTNSSPRTTSTATDR
jgi:competence protein ComGC